MDSLNFIGKQVCSCGKKFLFESNPKETVKKLRLGDDITRFKPASFKVKNKFIEIICPYCGSKIKIYPVIKNTQLIRYALSEKEADDILKNNYLKKGSYLYHPFKERELKLIGEDTTELLNLKELTIKPKEEIEVFGYIWIIDQVYKEYDKKYICKIHSKKDFLLERWLILEDNYFPVLKAEIFKEEEKNIEYDKFSEYYLKNELTMCV